MTIYPYRAPAIRVEQPMGSFYVVSLPARLLLDVSFSDRLSATYVEGTQSYELNGTQRVPQEKRLVQIADFINRTDAAFPNAIILAANHREEDGLSEEEPGSFDNSTETARIDRRWKIEIVRHDDQQAQHFELIIPTPHKLASIIDGQHRVFAFAKAAAPRREMQLLCSIYLDLPRPYQAQLFATINSTQKPVDKSLTFELFGYNVTEEPIRHWSPDKLAVFLSRRLATEHDSPLRGRVIISPVTDELLDELSRDKHWAVSTAVVVDGIMRLFTSNPKKDTNSLRAAAGQERSILRGQRKDRSPLRDYYLECNDALIYEAVKNFLIACERLFWRNATQDSFIVKTVGVQALFDILRSQIATVVGEKNIKVDRFIELLEPASDIDFAGADFRNASGSGRIAIRRAIQGAIEHEAPQNF